uniref:Uncharacterized protein n=1 Tax=Arundo donax TaxID=35708 RepID=A0A0A9GS50_ARUDO
MLSLSLASGSTSLRPVHMAPLSVTRIVWLLMVFNRSIVMIMMRPLFLLLI